MQLRPEILRSTSVTTRPPRPGDQPGRDRLCVGLEEFDRMKAEGAFLETANVHGNWYGTPRAPVEVALEDSKTMLLEIDVQGARAVRAAMPDALLIFVEPPSPEALRARLTGRGTDEEQVIERRLSDSAGELAAAAGFDHRVVNDDVEKAVGEVIRILEGTPGA